MGADGGQAVGPIPGTATYKGSCMRHVIPTSAPIRAIHTPKHPLLAFLSICQLDPFNPTHTHTSMYTKIPRETPWQAASGTGVRSAPGLVVEREEAGDVLQHLGARKAWDRKASRVGM